MNESDNIFNEIDSKSSDIDSSSDNSSSENEIIYDANEVSAVEPSERSEPGAADRKLSDEQLEDNYEDVSEETEEPEEEQDIPSSTIIQYVKDDESESGFTINELDVGELNEFISRENEVRGVNPTSNDYYTFISGDIYVYFADYLANYPLNEYKACHLRHWIQNTQYSSYYDDYYYLWYDYPSTECLEIYKANNSSQYVLSRTTQTVLNATIMYGSEQGNADLRKGVSYVQEIALLGAVGVCLVLYILSAFFRALRR